MLKLQLKGQPHTGKWLVKNTVVGSGSDCDFTIASKAVAMQHIELLVDHDLVYLKDRSRGKTIFVNDLPVGEYGPLKHRDTIKIGDALLEVIDPKADLTQTTQPLAPQWTLIATSGAISGQQFSFSTASVLGRDSQCEITIPGTYLSRRHAKLSPTEKGLVLEDLDSANGCFVNGERVTRALLQDGDVVSFDVLKFRIQAPLLNAEKRKAILNAVPNITDTVVTPNTNSPAEKQWKTKPTSLGNRAPEDEIVAKIAGPRPWVYYAAALTLGAAAFAYLLLNYA